MQRSAMILFTGLCFTGLIDGAGAQGADEKQFLSNTRQLIYEGKRSGEGYFSADGKRMIYQSEREEGNPFYQMYILDMETGDSTRVSPGMGKTTCGFIRPGHDEVLFGSTHRDPDTLKLQKDELNFRASGKKRRYAWDYDAAMDIFAGKADGSTSPTRLTDAPGYDAEASYSPDGSKIVFCSLRSAYPLKDLPELEQKRYEHDPAYFGEIYIMNADGSDVKRLTEAPGYDGGPFFSPDGERIIWRRFDKSGMIADVYTMKIDGTDQKRLTDFGAMSWAPYFHPSGEYVIFTANKLGFENFELFLVDAEGTREPIRVTYTDGFDGLPVFTPDGKKVAWATGRTEDKQSQIFMADWNHEAALKALKDGGPRKAAAETTTTVSH